MAEEKDHDTWMTLGVDPVDYVLVLLGFSRTAEEAKQAERRGSEEYAHMVYRKSFKFNNGIGREIHSWLRGCGIPIPQVNQVMNRLIVEIGKIMESRTSDQ
jgi:hypothetical protein